MRLGRRKRNRSRQDELTRRTREESRALARRQRVEARRALRAEAKSLDEVRVRVKGTALESRRQLRPVFAPASAFLSRIAPYVSGALLFAVRLVAAVPILVLAAAQAAIAWIATRGVDGALASAEVLRRVVTPLRTAAFVGIAAAVALGVSQFFDYRGVAVDAPAYSGELGATAPVPITERETAGGAHLWLLLPLAAAALLLVVATYRGRPRLARAVSLCGLLGLAVAIAIDLPQGLDEGRAGISFSGSEAQLLEGFWAEVSASAVLVLSGGLLALYSRGVRSKQRRRSGARKPAGRRRRSSRRVSPGLQAGP
ncbi:MAG TPA: hypothetical protein VFT14_02225 [Solirubrobacterales bacterium]|nr:hypothetical protein [Solirubrobacterales bacterium]